MSVMSMAVLISSLDEETNSISSQKRIGAQTFKDAKWMKDLIAGAEIELSASEVRHYIGARHSDGISKALIRLVPETHQINEYPSGSELYNMIFKGKPASSFSMMPNDLEDEMLGFQKFESYVAQGAIKRKDITIDSDFGPLKYVFFTLPEHEWRAECLALLKVVMHEYGWCSHLEHLEGTLLGLQ